MTPLKIALILIVIILFGAFTDDLPTFKKNPKIQNLYKSTLGLCVIFLFISVIYGIFYYIHI